MDLFYKKYTGTVTATDYVEWAEDQLHIDTLEIKKLAAMRTEGQLNPFEIEKMFEEAIASTGFDVPIRNQCFDHHLKGLQGQLLVPNDNALSVLKEIYDFTITHELFEEKMKWQEVSDAADDFQYGDNFNGYTAERIDEMILNTARKIWHGQTNKIKSLAIDFTLDPLLELDQKLLKQRSGKLLIDVDGELTITLGDRRFFWEPSITLLELGVALKRWRKKDLNANKDFHFFTMEHDEREGPILAFNQKSEGQWQLFSIWQEFEHVDMIGTADLLAAVDGYLAELEEVLVERFGLRYRDFMRR